MKDWSEYSKSKSVSGSSDNTKPSIKEYMLIKLTDNFLAFAVFTLCILFTSIGLIAVKQENNVWAFHAAELCLGVFLGLLKKSGK